MDVDIKQIFGDYFGRIFMVIGVILFYAGFLTMSPLGTLLSAVILFMAVAFFVAGFAFHVGWFSEGIKSKQTIAMVLICASIMTLTTGGILFFIKQLVFLSSVEAEGRRGGLLVPYEVVYPYAGISQILGLIGIVLFIAGFALKLHIG